MPASVRRLKPSQSAQNRLKSSVYTYSSFRLCWLCKMSLCNPTGFCRYIYPET